MFSFTEDVVLDPFLGTGTTTLAAMKAGRDSLRCNGSSLFADPRAVIPYASLPVVQVHAQGK
jgi:hypothetical protein